MLRMSPRFRYDAHPTFIYLFYFHVYPCVKSMFNFGQIIDLKL